ncbi:DNA-formamidopyrimidine glycosylase family protein [Nocardioides sp.]|uniref:Fpg/Nei family DNA glycosylase n=1 Tax=Nocardioides sp. TaxID=35761 RepID=UPI00321BD997
MPEGHSIHRLARRHQRDLAGERVTASSPQGRFADGAALLSGRTLDGTDAWGKHLFHRYDDLWLHVHLGLYGKFRDGSGPPPDPVGALRLRLVTDERWLDLRGPIACEVLSPDQRDSLLSRLGPDPLRRGADPAAAIARIGRSRRPVGALLMDQQVLAGVGNVYRAELLFRHRVSPFLAGRDLDSATWEAMWEDLVVLMRAGARSGRIITTEPDDRERPAGRPRRSDAHYVYRRAGLACRRCGTPVEIAAMEARNLFWCPVCQA